ncbi:hypothetical protein SAMN05421666_1153 [Roseovarius nanhaiticus]|uniref:Uncharacterized protein n=1 Tax=Roseovarius nanhaiticus TaxID=573024 RepID=A0A1N7FLP4_9RHOB|nr:hypothetical protein SAMN05216208_0983 [Roseovarius nanhaiticus]SIS01194.1 hypothetical protein SAMN05421666_1153 [Roseovarius nanhaiticus]
MEASTGIEPVYTDLQSVKKLKEINGVVFQTSPGQTVNLARKFQPLLCDLIVSRS